MLSNRTTTKSLSNLPKKRSLHHFHHVYQPGASITTPTTIHTALSISYPNFVHCAHRASCDLYDATDVDIDGVGVAV